MEELIIGLCIQHGKIKDSQLNNLISQQSTLDINEKVEALNSLLTKGKISISEESNEVVYQILSEQHSTSMKKLEGADILILQIVRESGDKGTWNGEIRQKTLIPTPQINKILTALQKQGLIFSQKSVNQNKKLWFIEGIKPHSEVTGGFLFADSEFDRNLMNELCMHIKLSLGDRTVGIKDVLEEMKKANRNLNEENLKEVLSSLVALGEIEERGGKYRAVKEFIADPIVLPCFACKLRAECRPGGIVNPAECEYLNSWLEF